MKTKYLICSLFLLLAVSLSSCESDMVAFSQDDDEANMDNVMFKYDRAAFDKNRAFWNERDLQNYQFTVTYYVNGYLDTSFEAVVQDRTPISHPVFNRSTISLGAWSNHTIPCWFQFMAFHYFEVIERSKMAVKNGDDTGCCHTELRSITFDVEYCPLYHYPKSFVWSISFETLECGSVETFTSHLKITDFKSLD